MKTQLDSDQSKIQENQQLIVKTKETMKDNEKKIEELRKVIMSKCN